MSVHLKFSLIFLKPPERFMVRTLRSQFRIGHKFPAGRAVSATHTYVRILCDDVRCNCTCVACALWTSLKHTKLKWRLQNSEIDSSGPDIFTNHKPTRSMIHGQRSCSLYTTQYMHTAYHMLKTMGALLHNKKTVGWSCSGILGTSKALSHTWGPFPSAIAHTTTCAWIKSKLNANGIDAQLRTCGCGTTHRKLPTTYSLNILRV